MPNLNNVEEGGGCPELSVPSCLLGTGELLQYSTVQYSTVQYSTVQYSTVQYSIRQ